MIDWANSAEERNYGVKRETDLRNLLDLLWILVTLLVLGGVFVFHSWERSTIVRMGYENQRLQEAEQDLLRREKLLLLEVETLKDPERIDSIARDVLGMTPLQARQILPPARPDPAKAAEGSLAMVAKDTSPPARRRTGNAN